MDKTTIDFVLTVPAIWSDLAKQSKLYILSVLFHVSAFAMALADGSGPETENAARSAGIRNEHGLEILSEPEAAALYTLKCSDFSSSVIRVSC
jgi:molecular chaperone DnaK (HSP70)